MSINNPPIGYKVYNIKLLLLASFLFLSHSYFSVSFAQTETLAVQKDADIVDEKKIDQLNLVKSLESTLIWIDKNQNELDDNEKELNRTKSELDRQTVEKNQALIIENLKKNKQNFIQLATGGLLSEIALQDYEEPDINWKNELADILKPLISEVKSATHKQRLKEELEAELKFYEDKSADLLAAKERISELLETIDNKQVEKKLKKLKEQLDDLLFEAQSYVEVLTVKCRELEQFQNTGSGWSVKIKNIFSGMFFHFFVSLFAGVLAYYVIKLLVDLLNKIDTANDRRLLFVTRAIQFFLRMAAILFGLSIYSVMLITLGEWALMSISMIFMFGIIFSLKEILPKYLAEMRTILNMGSIREGERIMYKGVPWTVKNLDFYTRIYNRDLASTLRLPIAEVADLKSRPSVKSELWFPTRKDDYVILEDGLYGQVKRQSPDNVLIDNFGSLVTYQTLDFLAAKPRNLSRQKFRVTTLIGVDYKYQKDINTQMLVELRHYVKKGLEKTVFVEHVTELDVEFSEANSSSLDYILIMSSKGSGAQYYLKMERWLQQVAVDCCNEFGWEIPFQQMVMHQAQGSTTE